jgi:hypothetical protein
LPSPDDDAADCLFALFEAANDEPIVEWSAIHERSWRELGAQT